MEQTHSMKIRMAQLFTTHMLPGEAHVHSDGSMHARELQGKRMYIPMVLCIPMRMAMDMDIIITMRIRRRS